MHENVDHIATLHEIVEEARRRLPDGIWNYIVGGAESETTILRNRQALDSIAFRPRVLRDVSGVDCSATLLGRTLRAPVRLAPSARCRTCTRQEARRLPRPQAGRASP